MEILAQPTAGLLKNFVPDTSLIQYFLDQEKNVSNGEKISFA
jgi:hypothetical protein